MSKELRTICWVYTECTFRDSKGHLFHKKHLRGYREPRKDILLNNRSIKIIIYTYTHREKHEVGKVANEKKEVKRKQDPVFASRLLVRGTWPLVID